MQADENRHRVSQAEWERLKREARDRASRLTEAEPPHCADGGSGE